MIKYLTQKEEDFLSALKKDWQQRGDKSFLSVMFFSGFDENEVVKNEVQELFRGSDLNRLIDQSDVIMGCCDSIYIGKYESCFWGTLSEGEFFAIGTKLHQIPYKIVCFLYGYQEDKNEVVERLKFAFKYDYSQYVEDYKLFCSQFGWEYVEEFEAPNSITEEFDNLVAEIEKYE